MPSFSSSYIHGQVTKIGPGRQAGNGASMAIQVQPGDGVKFREFAGSVVKLEGMYVCMYDVKFLQRIFLFYWIIYIMYMSTIFIFPHIDFKYIYMCMYVCMYVCTTSTMPTRP